jgi:hypothetical protein
MLPQISPCISFNVRKGADRSCLRSTPVKPVLSNIRLEGSGTTGPPTVPLKNPMLLEIASIVKVLT